MWHKVTNVVYRRFNKHWKSKKLWNANLPNSAKRWSLEIKTSSPDTQSFRVQMPECVNYSRKWLYLGNKYFLTCTSTSTQYNKTANNNGIVCSLHRLHMKYTIVQCSCLMSCVVNVAVFGVLPVRVKRRYSTTVIQTGFCLYLCLLADSLVQG